MFVTNEHNTTNGSTLYGIAGSSSRAWNRQVSTAPNEFRWTGIAHAVR